jgi:glyoxylase-like metal-dependent hydrolase (beta-lactamase superfamily II)
MSGARTMRWLTIILVLNFLTISLRANRPVVHEYSPSLVGVSPSKKQLQSLGWPNDIINSYAIKTSEGIVLIDTQNSPANARTIKWAVTEQFGDTSFVFIINTHGHSAHSGGNCIFPQDHIVAHVNSIGEIRNYDDLFLGQTVEFLRKKIIYTNNVLDTISTNTALADSIQESIDIYRSVENDLVDNYRARYPDITFDDRKTLTAGNRTIELVYMGKGHGDSDIAVYVPEEKALFTGNLFHLGAFQEASMPSFYAFRDNEIKKWISSLTHLLDPKREIKYVLTTHGKKPLKRDDLQFVLDYCKAVQEIVRKAKLNNMPIEEARNIQLVKPVFNQYSSVISINKKTEEMHERNIGIIWKHIQL